MHMCTHLPPDPEVVLAVPITQKTYESIYLKMPADTHLDVETVRGSYIVVDVGESPWGWMSLDDFRADYEPVDPDSSVEEFALFCRKPKK